MVLSKSTGGEDHLVKEFNQDDAYFEEKFYDEVRKFDRGMSYPERRPRKPMDVDSLNPFIIDKPDGEPSSQPYFAHEHKCRKPKPQPYFAHEQKSRKSKPQPYFAAEQDDEESNA